MKRAYLLRTPCDEKQTLGALIAPEGSGVFVARSLELPWKDNDPDISCYPVGTFICKWTLSPALGKETYEITGVPGRSGLRLHSANYFRQLKGCTAIGDAHKDIDIDGELDVIHSGATVEHFNEIMNKEDFELVVMEISA